LPAQVGDIWIKNDRTRMMVDTINRNGGIVMKIVSGRENEKQSVVYQTRADVVDSLWPNTADIRRSHASQKIFQKVLEEKQMPTSIRVSSHRPIKTVVFPAMPLSATEPTTVSESRREIGEIQPSIPVDILSLLETPNNHAALISAMTELLQTTEVREVIRAIDTLPVDKRKEKADLHLALRMAGAIEGMRDVDPGQLNVVAQVAPLGVRSPAEGPLRATERRISRTYNGVAGRSVIGEGDAAGKMTSKDYEYWIQATLNALQDERMAPRALFLVPNGDREIFKSAAHKMGILSDDEQYRADLRVQYVDQGENPDLFTQFLLGVEILDHDRKGPGAKASPGLLRLLSAIVESMKRDGMPIPIDTPEEILKQLFQGAVLITRRIDWEEIRDQYAAWQAVATSL
jgi:hypothetical protein